jgi:hypothetical protein
LRAFGAGDNRKCEARAERDDRRNNSCCDHRVIVA